MERTLRRRDHLSAESLYRGTGLRQNDGGAGRGGPRKMNNASAGAWLPQIESARSAADLVRLLRDYLAALTPEERAQLPAGCSAENISSSAQIQEWAVALAQADLRTSGAANAAGALHAAAIVFAAAGTRLPRVAE
jgi:hypothetical protein